MLHDGKAAATDALCTLVPSRPLPRTLARGAARLVGAVLTGPRGNREGRLELEDVRGIEERLRGHRLCVQPLFFSFRKGGEWGREEEGAAQGSLAAPSGKAGDSPAGVLTSLWLSPGPSHGASCPGTGVVTVVLGGADANGSRARRFGQRDLLFLLNFACPLMGTRGPA